MKTCAVLLTLALFALPVAHSAVILDQPLRPRIYVEAFPPAMPPSEEQEAINVSVGPMPADATAPCPCNPEVRLPLPQTAEQRAALRQAVDTLAIGGDATARLNAREQLTEAKDAGLAALIEYGLYSEHPDMRARSAELLGELGGRRVLKHLVEAFYSAAQPTIPPYQREYMRVLMREISRLTGNDYTVYIRGTTLAPKLADEMVQWWNANYNQLPPQLGEPALDLKAPDYTASLKRLRTLTLEKKEFGGQNYTADLVGPPPPVTQPAQEFVRYMPNTTTVNDFDRLTSTSQEPIVEKIVPPERDEPGRLREQQYIERLRAASAQTGQY